MHGHLDLGRLPLQHATDLVVQDRRRLLHHLRLQPRNLLLLLDLLLIKNLPDRPVIGVLRVPVQARYRGLCVLACLRHLPRVVGDDDRARRDGRARRARCIPRDRPLRVADGIARQIAHPLLHRRRHRLRVERIGAGVAHADAALLARVRRVVLHVPRGQRARAQHVLARCRRGRDHPAHQIRVALHVDVVAARARRDTALMHHRRIRAVGLALRDVRVAAEGRPVTERRKAQTHLRAAALRTAGVVVRVLSALHVQVAAHRGVHRVARRLRTTQVRIPTSVERQRVGGVHRRVHVRDRIPVRMRPVEARGQLQREAGLVAAQGHAHADARIRAAALAVLVRVVLTAFQGDIACRIERDVTPRDAGATRNNVAVHHLARRVLTRRRDAHVLPSAQRAALVDRGVGVRLARR
ncbi:hypothetical protein GO287_04970 [Ralstonia solanacearum]|nr:hypothetical protein [Ralstonia solanacearum]NKG08067.1 hypothetical protein [Ralstonia solanacearum]